MTNTPTGPTAETGMGRGGGVGAMDGGTWTNAVTIISELVEALPYDYRRSNNDGSGGMLYDGLTGIPVPVENRPETFTEYLRRDKVLAAIREGNLPESSWAAVAADVAASNVEWNDGSEQEEPDYERPTP